MTSIKLNKHTRSKGLEVVRGLCSTVAVTKNCGKGGYLRQFIQRLQQGFMYPNQVRACQVIQNQFINKAVYQTLPQNKIKRNTKKLEKKKKKKKAKKKGILPQYKTDGDSSMHKSKRRKLNDPSTQLKKDVDETSSDISKDISHDISNDNSNDIQMTDKNVKNTISNSNNWILPPILSINERSKKNKRKNVQNVPKLHEISENEDELDENKDDQPSETLEKCFESDINTDDDEIEPVYYSEQTARRLGLHNGDDDSKRGTKTGLRRSKRIREVYKKKKPNYVFKYDKNDL